MKNIFAFIGVIFVLMTVAIFLYNSALSVHVVEVFGVVVHRCVTTPEGVPFIKEAVINSLPLCKF